MTVGIIVQTRTGSSRLPSKVMMKADEDSIMLDYVINQLNHSKLHDKLVIATTVLEQDNVIFDHVTNRNIECFRGSLIDKIDRWLQAALKYKIDYFVNIDGDDLFCEPVFSILHSLQFLAPRDLFLKRKYWIIVNSNLKPEGTCLRSRSDS